MATKTTNYELTKPSGTESADIDVINANMDIIDGALNGKADSGHAHSEYALKSEIPDISGKADADHTHSEYATKSELEGKADSGHTHDNYATKSDLSGKSDTGHIHDDRYYTETEVNNLLTGKSDTDHTHDNYATKGEIPDVSGFATKSELEETNDTVSEHYTMLYEVYTAMPDKADKNHTHSNYATKTDLVYKQDPIKAGTGITIGTDGVTIGHSNSVDGRSVGSATLMPIITYDDQGHITGATSTPVYPPTSKGSAGQYWRSDGDGTGTWMTPSTTPTSDNDTLISSGGVYNALQNYLKKNEVDSALSSTSTNPLQNKVVNQAIYNQSVSLGNQISAKQDKLTAGSGITIENNVISATGGGSGGGVQVIPVEYANIATLSLNVGDILFISTMSVSGFNMLSGIFICTYSDSDMCTINGGYFRNDDDDEILGYDANAVFRFNDNSVAVSYYDPSYNHVSIKCYNLSGWLLKLS